MSDIIAAFDGAYRFLSNFWVEADGKTAEHRFQAAKAANVSDWEFVMAADTPGQAKYRGRSIQLREDWEEVKIEVMTRIVKEKFSDPTLRSWLDSTKDAELYEGNTWNDTFWGMDLNTWEGENNLGKILMQIREENRLEDSHGPVRQN